MTEKAVILLTRVRGNTREFLFIRSHNALYYRFPVVQKDSKETTARTIRKTLESLLHVEVDEVKKEGVTGYQPPSGTYTLLAIYTVHTKNEPKSVDQLDETVWLNKNDTLKRTAQMTNTMQDHVLPYLEENKLW